MAWPGRGSRLFVVLLAVSLAVAGPVIGATDAVHPATVDDGAHLQAAQTTPTDNTTRHEHPDRASGQQNLDSLRRWLAGRMAVQLESCTVEVGRGETDVCRFQDEYPDWLSLYVDVADATDSEADDQQAETFEQAMADHRQYAEAVSAYNRTYQAYLEARQAGDDERARRLARELRRQADQVTANGTEIRGDYRAIEADASVDLDAASASVNTTIDNVSETTAAVEAVEFEGTVLTATITPRQISFLSPGTVSGRLRTENGTPVANRSITVVVGHRTLTTETDAAGRFTVRYRPTTIPVVTERLPVRYRPRDESFYLGSRTNVSVAIDQVAPTVDLSLDRRTAAFGDELNATGSVSAAGVTAPNVSVRLRLGDRVVGTARSDEAGRFSQPLSIQPDDGPGAVDVRAAVAEEDRALAATAGTTTLTIEAAPTVLTLDPAVSGDRQVTVTGRLTTRAGDPIPDRPVTLAVNGTTVESVRTADDGTYRAQFTVPSSVLTGDGDVAVALTARFDGAQTNLRRSTASATLALSAPGTGGGGIPDALGRVIDAARTAPVSWIVGLLAVALGVALVAFRDRLLPGGPGPIWRSRGPSAPDAEPGSAGRTGSSPPPITPLDAAQVRLDTDADSAVMLAYTAVRESLADAGHPARSTADTHWEFLAACRDNGLDAEAIEQLTALTETYEAAAYGPTSIGKPEAETAVAIAERFV